MAKGDHIYVYRVTGVMRYQHHGIDMGDGSVVHLSPRHEVRIAIDDDSDRFSVRRDSLEEFTRGGQVFVATHPCGHTPDEVTAAAEAQIGKTGYNLFRGNCEHFATQCACGLAASRQVDVGEATLAAFISGTTKAFWSLSSKLGAKAALRSATKVHPAAMIADGVEVAVLAVGCASSMTGQQTRRLARVSSSLTAASVGAVLGGPAGAAVGLATHASSTALADQTVDLVRQLLSKPKAKPQSP